MPAGVDRGLCLTMLAVAFAWIAQIIFWRLVSWQISFRMDLLWIGLPIAAYFFASIVGSSFASAAGKFLGRLFPAWLLACGWIALTILLVILAILNKSIFLFGVSAALFGAGLSPLSWQAARLVRCGRSDFALFIATCCGVVSGVAFTSGTLFVNQHLPQLTIALACCMAVVWYAMHLRAMLQSDAHPSAIDAAVKNRHHTLASSAAHAGCGILMAAPIALTPTIEVLCGAGAAGFGYGLLAHYGAMLLPSLFSHQWRHAISRYALLSVYMLSLILGHVFPLLYLSRII